MYVFINLLDFFSQNNTISYEANMCVCVCIFITMLF